MSEKTRQSGSKNRSHEPAGDQDERAATGEGGQGDAPVEVSEEAAEIIRQLEAERNEAIDARTRSLADFQNYQRRAAENERRAYIEGAANIVHSILPVLDHFDLALQQKMEKITVEQLLGGVKMVRDELRKVLETCGVERLNPERGEPFNPTFHEAMMYETAEDVEPSHIVTVLQPGYRMGDKVLRPAKVAVAKTDGPSSEHADEANQE